MNDENVMMMREIDDVLVGWRIEVDSTPGHGATFHITFP